MPYLIRAQRMLDAFIIEKIKEQEQEDNRPQIRLPIPEDYPPEEEKKDIEQEPNHGIMRIGEDDEEEESKVKKT